MTVPAGYSGTPVIRKLGFKGAGPAVVMNPPRPYGDLLGEPVVITEDTVRAVCLPMGFVDI
ncbi:MAG: hypothetical protein V4516_02820 [Pseudomonadota bacterium]